MFSAPIANDASRAATGPADASWGEERDAALKAAVLQAEAHFRRCARGLTPPTPKD